MRSLRFELSPAAQATAGLASAFGHIAFATAGPSGFDALRQVLRSVQLNGRPDLKQLGSALKDLPYLVRAGYWRYMRKQLLWPTPATYQLHVVAEQLPRAENRITLSSKVDAFGCPLAAIDWRAGEQEQATIEAFTRRFKAYWERTGLSDIAALETATGEPGGADVPAGSGSDIFHPGGTTRMGRDGRSAVVDATLRTHSVINLYVASTSVFPSGASANPTLMLMAMVLRLAEHLVRKTRPARISIANNTG
jgi:choline dehydrogenase-like flavoprotein